MDKKDIEELIKFVKKTGVSEVSIEQEGLKITIKTHPSTQQVIKTTVPFSPPPAMAVSAAPAAPPAVPAAAGNDSKYITIKSPMIGTFYRSSSPDKPAFVNVGDEITAGKVLCIIEAMKLFNEIESEVSGKIVKVLIDNSTPVEYDQPLFLVEPA
jgi:acetyl-CoA carboxylase biotin carboxyl carrier protein